MLHRRLTRRSLVHATVGLGAAAVSLNHLTPTSAVAGSAAPAVANTPARAAQTSTPGSVPAPTNYKTWNLADYQRETGKTINLFHEAPSLAAKVAAKQLPALAERLPEDLLVVQPIETIGKYCPKLTGYGVNPTSFGNDVATARQQHLIGIYPDNQTLAPQLASSYELSSDSKAFTLKLRRGLKWSDGQPCTADDLLFWYKDILLNTDLTPAVSPQIAPGGKVVDVTKTDDATVVFKATVPFPTIIEYLATNIVVFPKHYLQHWHITYNKDADTVAKQEGFQNWVQAFQAHSAVGQMQTDPKLPSIDPWALARVDQFGNKYFERNPYYWKVDTAGNQLPYADTEVRLLTGNVETTILKIRNGEIDFGAEQLQLKDFPVLKDGEEAGHYRAFLWQGVTGADRRYQVNLTVKDPVLRKIFNDVRFRQALSLAINRDEINQTLFFGQATPRQFTAPPSSSYYEPSMGESFAQFDPDQANKLLDEMGLKRGGDGIRLRPDGKPLQFAVEDATTNEKMDELVRDYWAKIGVAVTIKSETRELYSQRAQANELQASVWFGDLVDEFNAHVQPFSFRPPWGIDNVPHSGAPWNTWRLSDGKQGEEPPPEFKELIDLTEQFRQTPRTSPDYLVRGKEMLSRNVKGLYVIGTVGLAPTPIIAKQNLRNFPVQGVMMSKFTPIQGDQWFLE